MAVVLAPITTPYTHDYCYVPLGTFLHDAAQIILTVDMNTKLAKFVDLYHDITQ